MTSPRTRLTRLLDRGFYPVELPPPFKTKNFSSLIGSFAPSDNYFGSTTFFDGATFRGPLRTFGVVNPVNYFLLSRFISDNWASIASVYRLSGSSGSRPKFPALSADGRAIDTASLAAKRQNQRHIASAYPVILSLDINRFYGSIYTHSLPWSVLGKDEAKRRHRSRSLSGHWSDTLDKFVRNCNQQQTVGLPIGPDTSRIISELILAQVDHELVSNGSKLSSAQIYHNIDDYQIGCLSVGEAEDAQSRFVRTISRYELRINDFKTSIDHGVAFAPSNFQRHFDAVTRQTGSSFVELLFEILYSQIQIHPNTNVVGYALKRFSRNLAKNPERDLVREYLQRLLFATPHQARWILPLLLGIYSVCGQNSEIKRIVHWGIETSARRNDVGSLLWFLYAAIFLRISLPSTICSHCIGLSNELVDLMLFHGRVEALFSFNPVEIRRRYRSSDFKSPAWLPIYEIERRGWDTSTSFSKLGSVDDYGSYYSRVRSENVEFYLTDPDRYTVQAFEGWNLTQQLFENNNGGEWNDEWDNYTTFFANSSLEDYA